MTFESYVIGTEDDKEELYEQANPPYNNEVINQISKLKRHQLEIFHPHIFDPKRVPASNCNSDMVENISNVVMEDNITQGDFQ